MTPPLTAAVTLEVPFHDVDSMGIVWHGHYLKYFEIARTALMRRVGMDLAEMNASGCVWPVVTCEVKYLRPLRYGQAFGWKPSCRTTTAGSRSPTPSLT